MARPPLSSRSDLFAGRYHWLLIPLLGLVALLLLVRAYPVGYDWQHTFSRVYESPRAIYESMPQFYNPPWLLALLPHAALPLRWGNAINFALNCIMLLIVARHFGGDLLTILLIFTSPVFFDLARTNNIEWIPMLALVAPPAIGLPLLLIKPHVVGCVALIWWKRSDNRLALLLPAALLLAGSLLIWGPWFLSPRTGVLGQEWNAAPWPIMVPLGLYLLYRAWQREEATLAILATPFLTPYLAFYSIPTLLAVAGGRYRREVICAYVAIWTFFIITLRRVG